MVVRDLNGKAKAVFSQQKVDWQMRTTDLKYATSLHRNIVVV